MAADSAVTINGVKTYNGVNKLFMLSNNPPMGIMVFGTSNFEGIPLETLIKEYRKHTNFGSMDSILDIKEDVYLSKIDKPHQEFYTSSLPNSAEDLNKLMKPYNVEVYYFPKTN